MVLLFVFGSCVIIALGLVLLHLLFVLYVIHFIIFPAGVHSVPAGPKIVLVPP